MSKLNSEGVLKPRQNNIGKPYSQVYFLPVIKLMFSSVFCLLYLGSDSEIRNGKYSFRHLGAEWYLAPKRRQDRVNHLSFEKTQTSCGKERGRLTEADIFKACLDSSREVSS